MNEDLKFTFDNVNDWLKFAEAKNAGMLVLNLGGVIGLLQAWGALTNSESTFFKVILIIAIVLFCISCIICLYSIMPILKKSFRAFKKLDEGEFEKRKTALNILFFGDIALLSADQFIGLFELKIGKALDSLEKDLANQITNNADICLQKYQAFHLASLFCTCALTCLILFGLIHISF